MSGIGGEIGGKIGNQQNPYFTSSGGVTPQESALASYDYGQNLLADLGQFEGGDAGGGISDSTMATQAAGGANIGKALDLAKASDINQSAEYGAYTNANAIQAANQGSALSQIAQLGKIGTAGATAADVSGGTAAGLANPVPTG